MSTPLFIQASTSENRYEVVSRLERALAELGAWILDHTAFSNFALTLHFEISSTRCGQLLDALAKCGLNLAQESTDRLRALELPASRDSAMSATDRTAYLQITFVHDEPDLRREVPAIPG